MAVNFLQRFHRGRGTALVRIAIGALVSLFAVPVAVGITVTTASAVVPNPTVTGPIVGGCSPSCPSPPGPVSGVHTPDIFGGQSNNPDLALYGYVESEYFFEGTATAFERDPTAAAWDSTGQWTARPSTTIAPTAYKTRMQVIQPSDPTKFNGTVVVEWLNVTAGLDTPPDYGYAHQELLRDGFIWVGVSAQSVSVNGGLPGGFGLKSFDPVRYGSLVHPGDSFSYDIYSQAAQAIRNPVGVNPLGSSAYVVTRMIADGESQSAMRMVTYIDAIQPLAQLYDGFFVHSRGGIGADLCSGAGCSLGTPPSNSNIRTDQGPVLVFETETDTVGHFGARQPDGTNYRLWEPAGTAHADSYDITYLMQNRPNQLASNPPVPGGYPVFACTFPYNSAGEHYLMNTALYRLNVWINGGTPPPSAPAPITVVGGVIQRDVYNIALGGIRLPEMDVPTQTHQGVGNVPSVFCRLFGRTVPLGSQCVGGTETPGTVCITNAQCVLGGTCQSVPLGSLYPSHGDYVTAYTTATNSQVAAGFILPVDAAQAIVAAGANCQDWPDATPCDDGTACTQTDTCQAGVCVGSNPIVCTANATCTGSGPSAACTCNSGFSGNGFTCSLAPCPANASGAPSCACNAGYIGAPAPTWTGSAWSGTCLLVNGQPCSDSTQCVSRICKAAVCVARSAVVAGVPTMPPWGLAMLAAGFLVAGTWVMRSRRGLKPMSSM